MSEITQILVAIEAGRSLAAEDQLPLVYDELRRLTAWHLTHEPHNQTLQATALVTEAGLRLVGQDDLRRNGRRHFLGATARWPGVSQIRPGWLVGSARTTPIPTVNEQKTS